jgi:hypothetical protein
MRLAGGRARGLSRSASSGAARYVVARLEQPERGQRSTAFAGSSRATAGARASPAPSSARRHVPSVAAIDRNRSRWASYDFGEICVMSTP